MNNAADSLPLLAFPVRMTCKNNGRQPYHIPDKRPAAKSGMPQTHKPLLQVHGNVLYDLYYHSQVDTPYKDREVYQHTAQVYLDIVYKDNYPFRIYFTTRWSNTSFFRNFSDLNFLYNSADFNNRVRRQVQQLLQQHLFADTLASLKRRLDEKQKEYLSMKDALNGPGYLQRLIRAREYKWLLAHRDTGAHIPALDTSGVSRALGSYGKYKFGGFGHQASGANKGDSLREALTDSASLVEKHEKDLRKLDSLEGSLGQLEKGYRTLQQLQATRIEQQRTELDRNGSGTALKEKLKSLHISDSSLPKGYQTLLSVKSFGIGRSMLDYSELSAKNISINGVQVEYNPSYYAAFALGTVDYRFRDYTMNNPVKGQYIGLGRLGWGPRDGSNLIFTLYTGRRQLYNSFAAGTGMPTPPNNPPQSPAPIPNYSLMGFTLEGHYKVSKNSNLIAEVGKSSSPYFSQDSARHRLPGGAVNLKDHSNEAYSLKYNIFIPLTQTQVMASYLHYGANFQSFSLFSSGTEQSAWSVRLSQPLFRQRLNITASIRTNDLSNPLVNAAYSSNTVFKSIQATLRLPKWPILSFGYSPSSQVLKISDNYFEENLFYTLTASASEVYKAGKVSLVSTLLYTQFYNKVTDTNFIYFNVRNLLLDQYAFFGRLTWELQLSAGLNAAYDLYVIDNKAEFRLNSWLSLGAGFKYNRQTVYDVTLWGYNGDATIRVPKLGEFRFLADKGFIPGNNKQLVPNNTGRLTYLKTF